MANEQNERRQLIVTPLPNVDPILGRQLWMLEDTRVLTLEALDGITEAVVNWTPPDGGNSIGTLLYHIMVVELDWLYEEILVRPGYESEVESLVPHDMRDENNRLTAVAQTSLQIHLARLAQARQLLVNRLQTMTVDDFYRARHLEPYDVTPEWVVHHLIQHEAEHRGEIADTRRRAELALSITP